MTPNAQARESYLAAAKTFDAMVTELRGKLTEMREQKIDAQKEPDKAASAIVTSSTTCKRS